MFTIQVSAATTLEELVENVDVDELQEITVGPLMALLKRRGNEGLVLILLNDENCPNVFNQTEIVKRAQERWKDRSTLLIRKRND